MDSDITSREHKMVIGRINKRIIIVNLVLPLNLIIGLVLIFANLLYMEKEKTENGLTVNNFLHAPLLELLEKADEANVPNWLLLVALDSGEAIYLAEHEGKKPLIFMEEEKNMDLILADIVKKTPDTISMVPFQYKGHSGLAIYMQDLLPAHLKVVQRPGYIGFVFFLTMIMFLLGLLQMNSYYNSIRRLIRASVRIANKDLDTEIHRGKQPELSKVFLAFDQMRKALKANREKESRFVMSVTHDLKTPLAAMRMYLEAMNDGYIEVSGEAEEAIKKILIKPGVLEDRIGELLEHSKLQTSVHKLKKEIIEVPSWIDEQSRFFDEECQMNQRKYTQKIDLSGQIKISGNLKLLNRAFSNLIDNACRYTKEGDSVKLKSYLSHGFLKIRIEDSGPGVPPAERQKIFELFYRADKGRNSRGMGIGLASVQSIIENHGGTISCGDSPLGGASFSVSLPIHEL